MICTILSAGEELQGNCMNEEEQPMLGAWDRVMTLVQHLIGQGYDSFYLNCEYGAPLWAAEFITMLKNLNRIRLHIVIPYEEQTTNWTEEMRDRYFAVHERADSVEMACTQYQEDCYKITEQRMIDESDLLVICGRDASLPDAAAYAKVQGVEVRTVNLV